MDLSARNEPKKITKHAGKIAGDSKSVEKKNRKELGRLTMSELKYLAKRHGVKPKKKVVPGAFYYEKKEPTKNEYIDALAENMTPEKIRAGLRRRSERR